MIDNKVTELRCKLWYCSLILVMFNNQDNVVT